MGDQIGKRRRNLIFAAPLFGDSIRKVGSLDFRLSIALFLVSLFIYSFHWFQVLPYLGFDAARLGWHAHDLLQEGIFPFYVYHPFGPTPLIIYVQALALAVFG